MQKITRRAALAAIPAVGLAPIVPAMAEPLDAELFRLMNDWRNQYDVVCNDPTNYANAEDDIELGRLRTIEAAVAALRPSTVEGFAAKLLVMTNFGEFDLDGPAECILSEARAISGFTPPPSMNRA